MCLENIILNKISETHNLKHHMVSLLWGNQIRREEQNKREMLSYREIDLSLQRQRDQQIEGGEEKKRWKKESVFCTCTNSTHGMETLYTANMY